MRLIILVTALLLSFFSTIVYATVSIDKINTPAFYFNCPQAVPTNDPRFCASFASVAQCHCMAAGLPAGMCKDVDAIYNRMIALFGKQIKACEYQHDKPSGTSVQECMDDWNCYRLGGKNSSGQLCSSTGRSCRK